MREYTEIRITSVTEELTTAFSPQQWVSFRFAERSLLAFTTGMVEEIRAENIILFETQAYYEGVSLGSTQQGLPLELYKNRMTREKMADGILVDRYFKASQKSDFKFLKDRPTAECRQLDMQELTLSTQEKYALELGLRPLSMDDKWVAYTEENTFYLHRSWTGIEMFRGEWVEKGNDEWGIINAQVPVENPMNLPNEKEFYLNFVRNQIKWKSKLLR